MALNPRKCDYLLINKDIAKESIELGKNTLHAEVEQKLLGIIIGKNLNFNLTHQTFNGMLSKSNDTTIHAKTTQKLII